MPNWLTALFSFLQGVIGLLLEQRGAARGRAEAQVEQVEVLEEEKKDAQKAANITSDLARAERLRKKYNRSK